MYVFTKRIFDIVLAFLLIIFLSPLLLVLVLAVKVSSKGPAIFKQIRLGKHGKHFKILKFRSMVLNAESQGVYEQKNDKRVTSLGRFLRKSSLDELPQLFNILKGEMSFVGPRPTLTYHPWTFCEYTTFQLKRFNVRPGVTGWAQVNGRKNVIWEERIKFDVFYVCNISFSFDIKIFFKTIGKVLGNKDNYNEVETRK